MNQASTGETCAPVRYRSWYLISAGVFVSLLVPSFAFMAVHLLRRHENGSGLFIALLDVLFIGVSLAAINNAADLIVDDRGVSRVLFGKVLQFIAWENVRLITVFPNFGGRGFNIFPKVNPRFTLMPSGKIGFFQQGSTSVDDIIEALNRYIAKYNIPLQVARKVGEARSPSKSIERL